MSYTEAVDKLEKSGQKFEHPVKWGLTCKLNTKGT